MKSDEDSKQKEQKKGQSPWTTEGYVSLHSLHLYHHSVVVPRKDHPPGLLMNPDDDGLCCCVFLFLCLDHGFKRLKS